MNIYKNQRGFTLIELIVVLAILAALVVIAIPQFAGSGDEADERANKANQQMLQSAVELYKTEKKTPAHATSGYPLILANLKGTGNTVPASKADYIREIPDLIAKRGKTVANNADEAINGGWTYDAATGLVSIPSAAAGVP